MANEQHSLQTYVSDMLALERHIRIPFDTQAKDNDFANSVVASDLVSRLTTLSDRHIANLSQTLENLGGHEASPAKSAVSQFEGFFAGAIDKMRKTKVSKSLRDDYTALSLCAAGYTMLQTTALALQGSSVAALAEQHLRDYAQAIISIGQALPQVVVEDLQDSGLAVDPSVVEPARRSAEQAWRGTAQAARSETGTIAGSPASEAFSMETTTTTDIGP